MGILGRLHWLLFEDDREKDDNEKSPSALDETDNNEKSPSVFDEIDSSMKDNNIIAGPQKTTGKQGKSRLWEDNESFEPVVLDGKQYDMYLIQAGLFIIEKNKASIGFIQRIFKIGFNRAARIMEQLEELGVVSKENGVQARRVLMNFEQFEDLIESMTHKTEEELIQEEVERLKSAISISLEGEDTSIAGETSIVKRLKTYEENESRAINLMKSKFHKVVSFSPEYLDYLVSLDNSIVANADYDEILDFVEALLARCSPNYCNLALIDTDGIFNLYLEYPGIIIANDTTKVISLCKLLSEEIKHRQKIIIENGFRKYEDYYNEFLKNQSNGTEYQNKTLKNEFIRPIFVIIRELYNIIDIPGFSKELEHLLLSSKRSGIYFICFTAYSPRVFLKKKLENLMQIQGNGWIRSLTKGHIRQDTKIPVPVENMSGAEFERYCAELLSKNGFKDIEITKASGDFGGDIIAVKDQIKYVIQCKRYQSSVGVQAIQEVIASRSIYKCHVGVVLTNNYFTKSAERLAENNNIILWDKDRLQKMIDHKTE